MDRLNAKEQEHLEREQEWMGKLSEKEQELLKREQEFSKELETCGTFKYVGCYSNGGGGVLNGGWERDSANTVERCMLKCRDFLYFALEDGSSCECANSIRAASKLVPDAQCSQRCPGNSTQFCGAPLRGSIYSKGVSG